MPLNMHNQPPAKPSIHIPFLVSHVIYVINGVTYILVQCEVSIRNREKRKAYNRITCTMSKCHKTPPFKHTSIHPRFPQNNNINGIFSNCTTKFHDNFFPQSDPTSLCRVCKHCLSHHPSKN